MGTLGNQMEKGNCCGGYNFYNEDFIWELFRQSYPRHQVQNVMPFMISQTEDWEGISGSGLQVLYGQFTLNEDAVDSLRLDMFDSSGIVHRFYENQGSTQNQSPAFMAAVEVSSSSAAPTGWQFVGWLVQLQGPVIQQGGLILDVQQMVGGSWPAASMLTPDFNPTALTPVYSNVDGVFTLPLGETEVRFSIDFARLPIGATGNYETYSVAEIQQMFRCAEGQVTVENVMNINETRARVTVYVTNLFNPYTVCFWLQDIAVNMIASEDITFPANACVIADQDGETVATCVTSLINNGTDSGYVKGLALVRGRLLTVPGTNAGAVFQNINYGSFTTMYLLESVAPGAFIANGNLNSDYFTGILWREPAFRIDGGSHA